MNQDWPTKEKDLTIARQIIEQYVNEHDTDALGLFEIVVDTTQKSMSFQLSSWVVQIAEHFSTLYGAEEGNYITSRIISRCITQGHTIH